jgi:hypothetical protein
MDMKRTKCISMVRNKPTAFFLCLLIICILTSCTIDLLTTKRGLDPEVSRLLKALPPAGSYPDADILYLLDEGIEEVFSDGRCSNTYHMVFKIVSERGKNYANCEIGYNSHTETVNLLYARTITPEGKIIPLKKNAIKVITPYSAYPSYSDYKELTFSMPAVGFGCVIDYKYVIEQREPTIEGEFASYFFVQTYNPVLLSRYKIITPEDMNLKYLVLNSLKDYQRSPTIIRQGGKKIYLWEYRDIPQILDENYMPPMEEVAFNISVTTMDSWEAFFSWWRNKIEGKINPNKGIKKKVAELTRDLMSSEEKTEAIFDYVKREIRYVSIDLGRSGYEPTSAQEVFENKYGDCKDQSTLLISMLKEAGIPAYYVLIPTNDVGDLIKDFPYPFQFNHCIVAIENGKGYRFLDPTAEYYRFAYLPDSDQNRGVLIFKDRENTFARTPLAEPQDNAVITQKQIEIKTDRAIEVEAKTFGSGSEEEFLRSFHIYLRPIEVKEFLEEFVDDISPGAKLLEHTHTDPLDFKKKFIEYIKCYAPDYCKKAGDILIFQVPLIGRSCDGTGKEERRYPILYWSKSYKKDEVEFNIPEGYELYYLPEPVEIKTAYFEYHSSYKKVGEKVLYQGEFIRKAVKLPPEKYTNYRKFCQMMEKSCERYVLFREKR